MSEDAARGARTHSVKCWPVPFGEMLAGQKTAEFRLNDRDFRTGDTLLIREWDQEAGHYTHRELTRSITHVLAEGFGLPKGYAMLSLATPSVSATASTGDVVERALVLRSWLDEYRPSMDHDVLHSWASDIVCDGRKLLAALSAPVVVPASADVGCPICEGKTDTANGWVCMAGCRDGKVLPTSANLLSNLKAHLLSLKPCSAPTPPSADGAEGWVVPDGFVTLGRFLQDVAADGAGVGDGGEVERQGKFWLIVHEPGLVPVRKGPWLSTGFCGVMREFIKAYPTAYLTVLTVDEAGVPDVQHGPEALQMTDGRSMSVGSKHNARTREAHRSALRPSSDQPGGEREVRLAHALEQCRERFKEYADSHARKLTADGDTKAKRNAEMVDLCTQALLPGSGER